MSVPSLEMAEQQLACLGQIDGRDAEIGRLRAENERFADLLKSIHERIGQWTTNPYIVNVWGPLIVIEAEIESALHLSRNERGIREELT